MNLPVLTLLPQIGRRRVAAANATLMDDWIARRDATGVVQDMLFTSSSNVTNYTHGDEEAARVQWDSSDGIMGNGCLSFDVISSTGSNSGNWRAPLNKSWTTDGQGFGTTRFYIQYRVKLGPNRLTPSNGGGGFKMMNLAEYRFSSPNSAGSHSGNEIVVNNQNWRGGLYAYREFPPGGTIGFEQDVEYGGTPYIELQTARDRGPAFTDPLERYCLYQSGNMSAGCWFFEEQTWFTVYLVIRIAQYGGGPNAGNEIDIYVARYGETSYTHLFDNRGFGIGSDALLPNGVNGIWFLPYDTNRINASYNTYQKYDQLLVSTQPIACPQVYA